MVDMVDSLVDQTISEGPEKSGEEEDSSRK
jgi:hypothetical protein